MRASDVIQVIRLHMDAAKAFGVTEEPKDDWTEEDDEVVETIVKDIDTKAAAGESAEGEERSGEGEDGRD